MKKIMRCVAIAIVAVVAAIGMSVSASAQTGEKTIGVMGGFSTYNGGGFSEVYMHYTLVPHVRLAPDLGYSFRSEGKSAFVLDVDVHFPFRIARGFNVYPLAGFAFNNWSYQGGGHASRCGMNIGGGFDVYLTKLLKLNIQAKYSMMNDTDGGFIGMGIGYNF